MFLCVCVCVCGVLCMCIYLDGERVKDVHPIHPILVLSPALPDREETWGEGKGCRISVHPRI